MAPGSPLAEAAGAGGAGGLGLTRSHLDDHQLGDGYGLPTAAAHAALRLVARAEEVLLVPVYTAKVMAGLLRLLVTGTIAVPVLFVHTRG